jgi:hypothetical protein
MRRGSAIAMLAAVALLLAAPAGAYDLPTRLNSVAHVYSLGAGEVRCDSPDEWRADDAFRFAWSYTNLRLDYSVLAPFLCEGASNVGSSAVPLWQQAAGTWTLVREAFHLRHWRFRRNEGKVLCQTIVYFTEAAMRLGATDEQANELYPYALALHRQTLELYPWYRDRTCVVPPWILPSVPPQRRALRSSRDSAHASARVTATVTHA